MGILNHVRIRNDFWLDELESPDTHEVMVDPVLADSLQRLRDIVGRPVKVDSGYRTPEHNIAVGGKPGSLHMAGRAVDVSCADLPLLPFTIAAVQADFRTVIAYRSENFLHCALDPADQIIVPREWMEEVKLGVGWKADLVYAFEDVFPS